MQDLDDQRADLQGEIDEAVENVQEAFDEVHDRVKAGIEAGEEPDEYLPEATDVEVGKVDHTQPRDGTLAMILDALLQFIIYAGGGTTLATMASRARRGMTMITGRPKPPKDPHAS